MDGASSTQVSTKRSRHITFDGDAPLPLGNQGGEEEEEEEEDIVLQTWFGNKGWESMCRYYDSITSTNDA